jgi:Spy/CpxP family protein refolding chaperone
MWNISSYRDGDCMRAKIIFAVLLLSTTAQGQHAGHAHGSASTPYTGFQHRKIKALSAEQMADLRAGRGMTSALAAELNGYPGPLHVLELADKLSLTAAQRATMEGLITTMRQDAVAAGEALIMAEAELDKLFAAGQADEASLTAKMHLVTHAQGQVRLIHLRTHLPARATLTAEQIALYSQLRGYRP